MDPAHPIAPAPRPASLVTPTDRQPNNQLTTSQPQAAAINTPISAAIGTNSPKPFPVQAAPSAPPLQSSPPQSSQAKTTGFSTTQQPVGPPSVYAPAQQVASGLLSQQSQPTPVFSGHPEVKRGDVSTLVESVPEQAAEIEVIPESPEISPELAEHIELVRRHEIELPGPIDVGTHEGQPVSIQPAAPVQPSIVLPVTQSDFQQGQTQPIDSAWRWLVEWVKRIITKYPGRVVYRST